MKNPTAPRLIFILLLIAFGACTRIIPHPFNFTGIAAIALFSGARINNRVLAFLAPIGAMFLSDLVIGFHTTKDMITIYCCFAATVALGILISERPGPPAGRKSVLPVALASIASSVMFYLVTNFEVWPGNPLYSQDLGGLVTSYIAGIPFFRNAVAGDLFYNAVFFGGLYLLENRFPLLFGQTVSRVEK